MTVSIGITISFAGMPSIKASKTAPSIPKNLKKDGVLILSGIIESRLDMVKSAYEAVGMEVVFERRKGEWFALVLKHQR